MRLGDLAIAVDQEGGRQRIHPAVQLGDRIVSLQDPIIDGQLGDERLHGRPPFFVHRDADDGETLVFVLALEVDEPGNLDLAGTAPGGPKIEQDDFSRVIGQVYDIAVAVILPLLLFPYYISWFA